MKTVIRPETEMKDSGVEWIKYIPENWNCVPLKRYFQFGKGLPITKADLTENGEKVISYGQIHAKFNTGVSVDDRLIRFVSSEYKSTNSNSLCSKGDIILADTSEDKEGCGNAVYIDCDEKIFAGYHTIILKSTKDNKYLAYLFQSDSWRTQIQTRVNGVKLFSITQKILNQCTIILPPLSEQQVIADYLDETCSKIDEIIAEAKASIDEYKKLKQSVIDKAVLQGLCNGMMKDSGNDLIGKIPLSWEMRKLKYVADFNPGIIIAYDAQKEVGYVPMNCVKNGYMNPLSTKISNMSTGLTGFQDGDIIIAKVTPCFENGNIAVAENLEQGVAFGSSELFVIRTHSINRHFMLYYLQNSVFKNQCISTMTGTGGLKRVSGYFVNNAYITYPPENEQQAIVDYLDAKCKQIDSLISEKQSLINDLEAYKKSLIYEVVTGKRRVV